MKVQTYICVASLVINLLLVGFVISDRVIGASSSIYIPPLYKGLAYTITIPNDSNITCASLENELGLRRGDVESISTDPEKGITIQFKKEVNLDSSQVQSVVDRVKGLIPKVESK
jgi:hypothetical protein